MGSLSLIQRLVEKRGKKKGKERMKPDSETPLIFTSSKVSEREMQRGERKRKKGRGESMESSPLLRGGDNLVKLRMLVRGKKKKRRGKKRTAIRKSPF